MRGRSVRPPLIFVDSYFAPSFLEDSIASLNPIPSSR